MWYDTTTFAAKGLHVGIDVNANPPAAVATLAVEVAKYWKLTWNDSALSAAAGRLAILRGMRSVADEVRAQQRQEVLAMSVEERVELARRLGEEGIALLMSAQGIDREEAIRRIRRTRHIGRRPSVANDDE